MGMTQREANVFFHTYKRLPLEITHGEGVYMYTADGRRYLDMFSGLAVNILGYGHARLVQAIEQQTRKYIHLSNFYLQEPQIRLAEMLAKASDFSRVFFCNSGTEAIEGAIKIARKWGSGKKKIELVGFSNAFHGRTLGALSMTDRPKYRDGFEPLLSHCRTIPFNDTNALRTIIGNHTLAVVLEFIQGESGIRTVSSQMVEELTALKSKYGFLLIADEVQSGLGRTGKLFGFHHYAVNPDIVVVAKPLGGGLPLGAILGNSTVAEVLQPGSHGTTFGGNPVACAAGAVVLEELLENGLIKNAESVGHTFKEELFKLQREFPRIVREVRGFGLMLGVDLDRDCEPVVAGMRERNILTNCTDQTVLRFLPPLTINQSHVQETITALREILGQLEQPDYVGEHESENTPALE